METVRLSGKFKAYQSGLDNVVAKCLVILKNASVFSEL